MTIDSPDNSNVLKTGIKYFPDVRLSALKYQEKPTDIFFEPNFQSINNISGYRKLSNGTGFDVYVSSEPSTVMKIERIALRPEKETSVKTEYSVHYPWISLGLGEERSELGDINDSIKGAKERRAAHLENKKRLEAVGIKTAKYLGSVLIDSKPFYKTGEIKPMYAELWEKLPGVKLNNNEEAVKKLYNSKDGRDELVKFALSLKDLSMQGYLHDVVGWDDNSQSYIPLRTRDGYPFPNGVFAAQNEISTKQELIAFDFNMGVDLTKMLWWKKEFENEGFLFSKDAETDLYSVQDNAKIVMENSVQSLFDELFEKELLSKMNPEAITRLESESGIYASQLSILIGQLELTVAILNKVKEIEKALP